MTSDGLRAFPCLRFQGLRWAEEAVRSLGRRRGRLLLWDSPRERATPELPGWERILLGAAPPALPASPTALPLREKAVDVAVLLHGFAELADEERWLALEEALRVARRLVLVVTPLAELKMELGLKLLYEFSVAHLGYDHPGTAGLRRRVNGRLPDEGRLVAWLEERRLCHAVFHFGSLFSSVVQEMLVQYLESLEKGKKLVGLFREMANLRFHTEETRGACLVGLLAISPGGERPLRKLREAFAGEEPARPGLTAEEMSLVHLLFHLRGLKADRGDANAEARLLRREEELEEARTEIARLRSRLDRIQSSPLLRAYARMAEKGDET